MLTPLCIKCINCCNTVITHNTELVKGFDKKICKKRKKPPSFPKAALNINKIT